MNRSGSRLKPLAPKPDSCRTSSLYPLSGPIATNHDGKNMNAFAGSHLGVPAGPLETVTSMDPKDYVWGVPQAQPGLFAAPGFASQPLFTGPQGLFQTQATGLNGFIQASAAAGSSAGFTAGTMPMPQLQTRLQGSTSDVSHVLAPRPQDPTSTAPVSQSLPISQPLPEQAEVSLEQVDDLLNMAFDDDCIKKLLSEPHAATAPADGNIFGSPPERISELHRAGSPCKGRSSPGPSHNSASTGCAATSSPEMLDATDLHFLMEETSVLESMSGLGDLDLHLLEGGLADVETTSGTAMSAATTTFCPASGSVTRALKRAKSEAGTGADQGQNGYNPLLSLALNDALASINGFLASSASIPEEKRQAAVAAIAALQAHSSPRQEDQVVQVDPSADAVAALTKANSFPRRKRASRV